MGERGCDQMSLLPELTTEEVERYARHIVLRDIGGPGQRKLKAAKVCVIGAGGLGAPLLLYLAAAGVGELTIIDDDVVSLSNLQRQILFGAADLGLPKTAVAAQVLQKLNPHVRIVTRPVRLDQGNVRELIEDCDVVADGSDNFDTRYLVSDACFYVKKPLVTAAVGQFDGSLTTLRPFETGPDGKPNPTYRCLFPQKPPPGALPTCAEAGVLGALTGMVGSLMALEVVREIVGFGTSMVGRLALFDLAAMRFETLTYGWDEDNPLNGEGALIPSPARGEGSR
jgi:adenylyltransferase/sulfurtransferase